MWYIIITVVIIGLAIFVKSYRKIYRLSEDGTLLVAYTKEAMLKTYLGKDIPVDEQFSKLVQACCLLNNFLEKTKGMRGTYSFSIRENGPVYGETKTVQLASFITTVEQVLNKRANSLPTEYREKIERYMKDPFSEESIKLSEKEASIVSSEDWGLPFMKKLKADHKRNMMNSDFMFVLFK